MTKRVQTFILLIIIGTLFVLPNFYQNKWKAVEPEYYEEWQTRYDRFVIARLVKTRQDGFWSAGGLLGLGDVSTLDFRSSTNRHQYSTYQNGERFEIYTVYKSNPGFQAVFYGIMDKMGIGGSAKLESFRGITSLLSAVGFGLIFAAIVTEFGILAGISTILFATFSIWIVLPGGSIFWNLWALFLPLIISGYLLTDASKRCIYNARRIYLLLFIATLLRILFSGFDIITTGMIMTTVPFVYYAIKDKWEWKLFLDRFIKSGFAISAGTLTGMVIMLVQIIANDGSLVSAFNYFEDRFGHHLAGSSKYFTSGNVQATPISIIEITRKYLVMPAINIRLPGPDRQVLYWHLVVLFAACTALYFLFHKKREGYPRKAIALIATTWYSILAPLSWYILFRPHSTIHTHVNTMGWQMPFTLLGFALCGFVITDLFRKQSA